MLICLILLNIFTCRHEKEEIVKTESWNKILQVDLHVYNLHFKNILIILVLYVTPAMLNKKVHYPS